MKILFLTLDCGVGSGWNRYSLGIAQTLLNGGHEIEMIVGDDAREYASIFPSALRILPNPTSVRRTNLLFPVYALRALMMRYYQFKQCDVIHCVVESYVPCAWLLSVLLRKPLIITAHGSFAVKPFVLHRAAWLYRQCYRSAQTIVCVSEFTRRRLQSYVPEARAQVIHNGVAVIPVAQSSGDRSLVLSVGALKHRKGYHLLLEAFASVAARIPAAECVMVGDRNEERYVQSLEQRIHDLGLESRVHLRHGVSESELGDLYAQARVFVMAPVSTPDEFEGFGLVYLEANLHGVPVVGMEGSGAPEAISEGVSGYVVQEGDTEALEAKIELILTDNTLWTKLSQGAREWAAEHSWSQVAVALEAVYQSRN